MTEHRTQKRRELGLLLVHHSTVFAVFLLYSQTSKWIGEQEQLMCPNKDRVITSEAQQKKNEAVA